MVAARLVVDNRRSVSDGQLLSAGELHPDRWWLRTLAPTLLVAAAFCASSATAAAVPNICTITGVNKQVAAAVLGKGSLFGNAATEAPTSPPNLGAYCSIATGTGSTSSLEVELYAANALPTLASYYERGSARKTLRGLGFGAVYLLSGDHNIDVALFKTKKYTVLIDNSAFGGASPSSYPTEKEYLALAQAIYAHLG